MSKISIFTVCFEWYWFALFMRFLRVETGIKICTENQPSFYFHLKDLLMTYKKYCKNSIRYFFRWLFCRSTSTWSLEEMHAANHLHFPYFLAKYPNTARIPPTINDTVTIMTAASWNITKSIALWSWCQKESTSVPIKRGFPPFPALPPVPTMI